MNDDYYLMWLLSVKGMSSAKAGLLLECFETAENIWRASEHALRKAPSIMPSMIDSLLASRNEDMLYELIDRLEQKGFQFISIHNDKYPALLKTISDPPPGLFVDGLLPNDSLPKVSIIGSRTCSEYGMTVAVSFAEALARQGVVVVSGMAKGIDGMAHRGALNGGGYTVAVLGNGVDICYPAQHFALKNEIVQNGCTISEFPLGTRPEKYNFPARNRIISGLSDIVLVVEAELRSGTSITVDQALEQGREVMAIPGSIYNKCSSGTNNLIRIGVTAATSVEDVLVELESIHPEFRNSIKNSTIENNRQKIRSTLAPEENIVYACISLEPIQIDELLKQTDLTIQQLQFELVNLEINRHIRRLPGQRYIRIM